jgi:type I restriction enzyme S subunit
MVEGKDRLSSSSATVLLAEDAFSSAVSSKWLISSRLRLDAEYYTKDVFRARQLVAANPQQRLDQCVERVFNLPRFKRIYSQQDSGIPYLSASESLFFRPTSERFLSTSKTKNIDQYLVKKNWAIMTCSGTVGRVTLVTDRLSKFAFTHDLMRFVPKGSSKLGYLSAYLSSCVGQTLLTKDQYGAAVKHLESQHVSSIPVPLLAESVQDDINEQIVKACSLREQANQLLDRAQIMLNDELGLPPLSPEELAKDKPNIFSIRSSELNFRFDASYHNPLIRTIAHKMKNGRFQIAPMEKFGQVYIPPRFARTYVERNQGIPFLQGKHIVEIKPYDIKCISRKATKHIEKWIIKQGTVLITCSGTIGRVSLVPKVWDGWAATQHILRIIPHESGDDGYLASFLMSPYGYHQLLAKTYGAVIGEIAEEHVRPIFVPDASSDVKRRIGQFAIEAFELKEQANSIENNAIAKLEGDLEAQRRA